MSRSPVVASLDTVHQEDMKEESRFRAGLPGLQVGHDDCEVPESIHQQNMQRQSNAGSTLGHIGPSLARTTLKYFV